MLSWDWNVLQPNLTLMSSSDFHRSSFSRWNYVHAALFFWLLSLIDALQNHVWSVGPFDRNHLKLEIVSNNHSWVRVFANFALEFVKIVCFDHTNDFLFDLTIDPLFKAFCMNESTGALAFAWRNDEVFLLIIVTKADFTGSLNFLSGFENSIEFAQKNVFQDFFVFRFGKSSDLDNFKLNSSNFDDISGFWIRTKLT